MRVLILAPIGRDARLLSDTIQGLGNKTAIAPDAGAMLKMLADGAGTAVMTEEALGTEPVRLLGEWLGSQPPWSDPPFIVLTTAGRPTRQNHLRGQALQTLGNFTLIERPVRPETIESAVRVALRARMRQYEIRSRQEALLQANADLEQFAHSASHDLREPLRSIGIYSEVLAKEYAPVLDRRGAEFLAFITSGAQRMDRLLSDLLSYAHVSSIADEKLEPIDTNRALCTALENLAGAIRESDAQIRMGEMPVVRIHESHLAQVFQNLIGNAIKYRRDEERLQISVSADRSEGHWIFCVEDNGIGVPAAYKEIIFGIFKRLHTSNKYSGTGMGLAICQRIVERYQGRIWVESEFGHGSKFFFRIPA